MKKIKAHLLGNVVTSNAAEAHSLCKKSGFGEPDEDKIRYSLSESLFLVETKKIEIFSKNKALPKEELLTRFKRIDKKIQIKYIVFKDLRKKGYVVKTALKFGSDFRVYEKGSKPGTKHAKWIVFVDNESKRLTWHEFSAKNRVAHSTRKKLLLAIVDEENSVTYYEVSWVKP